MKRKQIALALILAAAVQAAAQAAEVKAKLAGHIVMPIDTVIPAPEYAPADLQHAGKYTTGNRVEQIGAGPGMDGERSTAYALPIAGQSVQGHSGIKHMPDGTYWVLTDNGFGKKANSPDAMLFLNQYVLDFKANRYKHLKTIFLHDPDRKVPFHIVNESTRERYLTGADFDVESFQFTDDALWIGDEFGPFLIKADKSGKVLAVYDTYVDGKIVMSPDHPRFASSGRPDKPDTFAVMRSKGFEGMAMSPDGHYLYPMFEGPLWNGNDWETADGRPALRILEFDAREEKWTGRSWMYPLEGADYAIGDFNMIDETHGLVVERDEGEGT